ncbi:MAG: hypothetical protein SNG14_02805 [Rikenellaceae bacterium]
MIRLFFTFLAVIATMSCTISEVDETYPAEPEEELSSGEVSDEEEGEEGEEEKEPENNEPEVVRETLIFSELKATDEYQGLSAQAQLAKAVEQLSEGGILQLEEGETYTLDADLTINKSITLQGVGETPTPDMDSATSLSQVTGAGEINTTIQLTSKNTSLVIAADGVEFKHLKINGYETGQSKGNLIEFDGIRSNFRCENVHLYGGSYSISARYYMSPALECHYTTFEDFYNRGFFINRIYETYEGVNFTQLAKCHFYRCYFKVLSPLTSDTRAIGMNAGNTENPNILDLDGLTIEECYFHDIGIGSSKTQNYNIINCEFYLEQLFDSAIHLEEFANQVTISGCLFRCNNYDEAIMGVFDNSVAKNNTVIGECGGFSIGRYAEGMVIKDNDLSLASNNNAKGRIISLWDGVGSRDITVTGNNMSGEIYIQATSENQSSINISNNGAATTNIKTTTGYDYPLEDGATCRIKSYYNSLYLAATGANANVVTTSAEDESSLWEVTQVWPNRYNAYNAKYDTYLYIEEDAEAYTAEDALARCIILETMRFDAANERLPIWDFTVQANGYSIVGPGGGNDGCVGIVGSNIQCLKYADERDDSEVTDERCLWSLVEVK